MSKRIKAGFEEEKKTDVSIDALYFGSDGNDTFNGSNENDQMYGYAGNDNLYGDDGNDTLYGGEGNDILQGGNGRDSIYGDEGADTMEGWNGRDLMYGGAGEDLLYGGDGDDVLEGGDDSDTLYGEVGNDTLKGGGGHDTLRGEWGVDTLIGGAGFDEFWGTDGLDAMYDGGSGIDRLILDIYPGAAFNIDLSITDEQFIRDDATQGIVIRGIEHVSASFLDDTLRGNGSDNWLEGLFGEDVLIGRGGDDLLDGGFSDDTLEGGSGNDLLIGGDGSDTLAGGDGQDVFHFDHAYPEDGYIDTILDFNVARDTISLNAVEGAFEIPADGDLTPYFRANASGTAQDADDYLVYNTSTGQLYYDSDGNGAEAAVQFALIGVNNHAALTAANFHLSLP